MSGKTVRSETPGTVGERVSVAEQRRIFDTCREYFGEGPGLRAASFCRDSPLDCARWPHPEGMDAPRRVAWHAERCFGEACEVCTTICVAAGGGEGITRELCASCGTCVEHCLGGALRLE